VGNAGGRRTMAKAIIPIKGLREQLGGTAAKALRAFIEQRILAQEIDVET
jgi:hypothetical protein